MPDRSIPLRRRLFLLAAAGILPMALLSGVGLVVLLNQQREQAASSGIELARAMSTAVDGELRAAGSILKSLSTSIDTDAGLLRFEDRARSVLESQPHWHAIALYSADGRRVADSRAGFAANPRPLDDRDSFERVVRTRQPVTSNLVRDPQFGWIFRERVPVMRGNQLAYVLTAIASPELVRDVIARQQVPEAWVVSVFDAADRRVARTRAHAENLAGAPSPTLQALLGRGGSQGFDVTHSIEGDRIYTPFNRLNNGWTVALGIPAPRVDGPALQSLAVYGGGILVSVAVGLIMAIQIGAGINRPMSGLRQAALALGRREPITPPVTDIQELRDVSAALEAAAAERARGEAEREDLLRNERAARQSAETADRAKDEFLAVLSHELRTPLNAVYGWARLLQDHQLDQAATTRAIDAIVRNSQAQVQLIDDLLDVSRIVTGKLRLDVRQVDLTEVINEALDAVTPAAEAKGLRIQKVLDPRAGPVTGDPARLQQVVWNLLINAVKFTPRGGRIQVQLQRVNSHVEIVVSDTGEGMPAELLPYVFERFRQSDSSSTRSHGGLGIGLTLARHLMDLHGGTIHAASPGPGQGSTFRVTLPMAIVDAAALPGRADPGVVTGPAAGASSQRLDGLRVLAVDDDPEALALVQATLSAAGASVRGCRSADEAIDALREIRPDVLLSDIEMAGEDGYSLIARVRALPAAEGGRTPAAALTAYGRARDRVRAIAAGYHMHVPKPVDPAELRTIVASLAERAKD